MQGRDARATAARSTSKRGRGTLVRRVAAASLVVLAAAYAGGVVGGGTAGAASDPFSGPLPACRIGDELTPHRAPSDWARTLLDPHFALAPDDVPPDLVRLRDAGIDAAGSIRSFVIPDLRAMMDAARHAGAPLRITSAYRSFEHQKRTFASLEEAYGRDEALRSAARPGHSEHQLGTTIDVEGGREFLATHASQFGFVMSYAPEHSPGTTCYKPETWHFRYIGRTAAAELVASGQSLRAWLWERQAP